MPDAGGKIRGIATTGKAGERIEAIFGPKNPDCKTCGDTKLVIAHSHEDYGVSFESEYCPDCVTLCEFCQDYEATEKIHGAPSCLDCWEKAYDLD